ncbi:MAG: transposase [Bacteroidetes bacterium]|nr:transposase [Bacteroidota bacterium]
MYYEKLEEGHFYHIYNRGNNKENLFKNVDNYMYFLKLMQKHLFPYFNILAYVLLPNHFHLILQLNCESGTASQKLSNFFNAYTKAINKAFDRTGSLFQKQFQRKKIDEEDYLRNSIIYVHLNPQIHGFVDNFEDYKFSSFPIYKTNGETFLNKIQAIELFDDLENFLYCHRNRKFEGDNFKDDFN